MTTAATPGQNGERWLVCGHGLLTDPSDLWSFCESVLHLLGDNPTGIGEHATGNRIEPWENFPQEAWTRGRLFGATGEIQWRGYGPLMRVAVLIDANDEAQGQALCEQLLANGLGTCHVQPQRRKTGQMALQTNEEAFTRAQVAYYGDEDGPSRFVRYVRVTGEG